MGMRFVILLVHVLHVSTVPVIPTSIPTVVPISPAPTDAFLTACAQRAPSCESVWTAPVPPLYRVPVSTTQGGTILVNTSAAPSKAARFHVLSLLGYFQGGPFYRVLSHSKNHSFVSQFGYRGTPAVDLAWLALQTSNETERVLLSNARGTVAFGTGEVANSGSPGNCTATECSLGFSVELFINLADNSAKLDPMDFAPFGVVEGEEGMAVVDSLFAGYGECADLCSQDPEDSYCVRSGGGFAGVNLTRFLSPGGGWDDYLRTNFPLLDSVLFG